LFNAANGISANASFFNTINTQNQTDPLIIETDLALGSKQITTFKANVDQIESRSSLDINVNSNLIIDQTKGLSTNYFLVNSINSRTANSNVTIETDLNFSAGKMLTVFKGRFDQIESRSNTNIAVDANLLIDATKYIQSDIRTNNINAISGGLVNINNSVDINGNLTLDPTTTDNNAINVLLQNGSGLVTKQSHRTILNKARIQNFTTSTLSVVSNLSTTPTEANYTYEVDSLNLNNHSFTLHSFDHYIDTPTNKITLIIPGSVIAPYHFICQDIQLKINSTWETCFLFWNQGFNEIFLCRKDSSNFPILSSISFGLQPIIEGVPGSIAGLQLNYVTSGMTYN
jgi:hypothetical protein